MFIQQYIPFLFCSWQWNTQQDRSVYSTWINPNEQKYWKDEQNLLGWMVLQELVQGFGVLQHFWKIYFAPKHWYTRHVHCKKYKWREHINLVFWKIRNCRSIQYYLVLGAILAEIGRGDRDRWSFPIRSRSWGEHGSYFPEFDDHDHEWSWLIFLVNDRKMIADP